MLSCRVICMETIHVLFLRSQPGDRPINRLTGLLGGLLHANDGFYHVELCIPHPQGGYVSSSVYQNETVSLNRMKTFANPDYLVHSMTISRPQLATLWHHLKSAHEAGVGFDRVGMCCSIFPCSPVCCVRSDATFCSRYVTEALKAADVAAVDTLHAPSTSPSKLLRCLEAHNQNVVVGSVEHKQRQMRESPTPATLGHSYMRLTSL